MSVSLSLRGSATSAIRSRQDTRLFSRCRVLCNQSQPESPRYVDIPQPVQPSLPVRERVKGFLPVPRELFRGRSGTDEQLQRLLRREPAKLPPRTAISDRAVWENRMMLLRKRNRWEGSLELRKRKMDNAETRDRRSRSRIAAREEALRAAIGEDERLTAQSNNFDVGELMRGNSLAGSSGRSEAKYLRREASKHNERLRALHSLYTKAGSFIVSKSQLDEAIESAFGTEDNPAIFKTAYSDINEANSIWAYGRPETLQDKANALEKQSKSHAQGGFNSAALDNIKTARINRIVEELTGGDLGEDLLNPNSKAP